MLNTTTLQCVDLSDVLAALDIRENDLDLFYQHLDGVSFGDASFTLIGNIFFLGIVTDYFLAVGATPAELDKIEAEYWSIVPQDAYINLEG